MAPNKVSLPNSMGGLMRYFDEYKARFEMSPMHVMILCVAIMILILLLHQYGRALVGF